jgi:RimJ/RimL family protein N-acetyltransferase
MARARLDFHLAMNPTTLRTRRLILRPPDPSDAEAIQPCLGDRRVTEMTSLNPHPHS